MELSLHDCAFGPVLIGTTQTYGTNISKLVSVELGKDADECYRNFINKWGKSNPNVTARVNTVIVKQTIDSINTGVIDPSLEIDLYGTGTYFQRKVWEAIRTIQIGSTVSYADIAKQIQRPDSARAIGTACGANPIAIIVPCHRVVKNDGKSGGYRWGEPLKEQLLARERI